MCAGLRSILLRGCRGEPEDYDRHDEDPNQEQWPYAAGTKVVIGEEAAPGMPSDEMAESEFKGNGEQEPANTNGPSLCRRLKGPKAMENPHDRARRQYCRDC